MIKTSHSVNWISWFTTTQKRMREKLAISDKMTVCRCIIVFKKTSLKLGFIFMMKKGDKYIGHAVAAQLWSHTVYHHTVKEMLASFWPMFSKLRRWNIKTYSTILSTTRKVIIYSREVLRFMMFWITIARCAASIVYNIDMMDTDKSTSICSECACRCWTLRNFLHMTQH